MSEMIKISVSNWNSNAQFIAMKAKKVFENVTFGNFEFHKGCWDGCKFVNCTFGTMNPNYRIFVNRQNIVFENCTFCDHGAFTKGLLTSCKFIGCKFENGWIYTVFLSSSFTDCKFARCNFYENRFMKCSFKENRFMKCSFKRC